METWREVEEDKKVVKEVSEEKEEEKRSCWGS